MNGLCDAGWDRDRVALNSCQLYNGATIAAKLVDVAGLQTLDYEEHASTPVINGYLRGYAAAWLPMPDPPDHGAFVIAGSS